MVPSVVLQDSGLSVAVESSQQEGPGEGAQAEIKVNQLIMVFCCVFAQKFYQISNIGLIL